MFGIREGMLQLKKRGWIETMLLFWKKGMHSVNENQEGLLIAWATNFFFFFFQEGKEILFIILTYNSNSITLNIQNIILAIARI